MTLHAFNRRIEITSTYHRRRRPNRRADFARALRHDTAVMAGIVCGTVAVVTALAALGGCL